MALPPVIQSEGLTSLPSSYVAAYHRFRHILADNLVASTQLAASEQAAELTMGGLVDEVDSGVPIPNAIGLAPSQTERVWLVAEPDLVFRAVRQFVSHIAAERHWLAEFQRRANYVFEALRSTELQKLQEAAITSLTCVSDNPESQIWEKWLRNRISTVSDLEQLEQAARHINKANEFSVADPKTLDGLTLFCRELLDAIDRDGLPGCVVMWNIYSEVHGEASVFECNATDYFAVGQPNGQFGHMLFWFADAADAFTLWLLRSPSPDVAPVTDDDKAFA